MNLSITYMLRMSVTKLQNDFESQVDRYNINTLCQIIWISVLFSINMAVFVLRNQISETLVKTCSSTRALK